MGDSPKAAQAGSPRKASKIDMTGSLLIVSMVEATRMKLGSVQNPLFPYMVAKFKDAVYRTETVDAAVVSSVSDMRWKAAHGEGSVARARARTQGEADCCRADIARVVPHALSMPLARTPSPCQG